MTSELASLRERVSKLTGPDGAVNEAIWHALLCPPPPYHPRYVPQFHDRPEFRFTSSVDAVLSLIEKKLPGWASGFDAGPKTIIAFVDRHDYADRWLSAAFTAEAATPALALLLALLEALTTSGGK